MGLTINDRDLAGVIEHIGNLAQPATAASPTIGMNVRLIRFAPRLFIARNAPLLHQHRLPRCRDRTTNVRNGESMTASRRPFRMSMNSAQSQKRFHLRTRQSQQPRANWQSRSN